MKTRILIVEDDPDIAELVARYLERAGFQTDTGGQRTRGVANRRGATARFADPRPDAARRSMASRSVDRCALSAATAALPIIMLDRSRRRVRANRRPRTGRRRLPRQAVQSRRTGCARPGACSRRVATQSVVRVQTTAAASLRTISRRRRSTHGSRQRPRRHADGQGISPAAIPAGASRPRALARPAADRCVGLPPTPAARAPWTSTSDGCAKSCRS